MTDRIVSVGDAVKVTDSSRRELQDGEVVKIGRTLVYIRCGNDITAFQLDTQRANDKWGGRLFRTLPQQVQREHEAAIRAILSAHDLHPRNLPLEVLEQLAAVLTAYDESKGAS